MMTEMIEIKPQKQIDGPPKNPKRRTKAWMNAVQTYVTNQAKWEAACSYCEDRGMSFRLISEKHLGLK
jgi:DNA primase